MPVCNAAGEKFPKVADNFFIKVNADDSSELGVVEGKGQGVLFFPFVKHQNENLKLQDAGTELGVRSKDFTILHTLN